MPTSGKNVNAQIIMKQSSTFTFDEKNVGCCTHSGSYTWQKVKGTCFRKTTV